jgi:hypothetical protein
MKLIFNIPSSIYLLIYFGFCWPVVNTKQNFVGQRSNFYITIFLLPKSTICTEVYGFKPLHSLCIAFFSCLFVSRVRLMVCLLPDKRVRICGVPHGHIPPPWTPFKGAYFGGRDLNPVGWQTSRGHNRWLLVDKRGDFSWTLLVTSRGHFCPREVLFSGEFSWTFFGWILVDILGEFSWTFDSNDIIKQ